MIYNPLYLSSVHSNTHPFLFTPFWNKHTSPIFNTNCTFDNFAVKNRGVKTSQLSARMIKVLKPILRGKPAHIIYSMNEWVCRLLAWCSDEDVVHWKRGGGASAAAKHLAQARGTRANQSSAVWKYRQTPPVKLFQWVAKMDLEGFTVKDTGVY